VQILTWETAIKMRYEGTADVLVEYTEEIRSPSVTWRLPAVMRLKKTSKRNKARQVRFSRTGVYQRDKYRCAYCRNKFKYSELTLDHIVARSKGGLTEWTNVTSACKKCNGDKGDKSCDQWGRWPATDPIIPRSLPESSPVSNLAHVPEEWSGWVSK
jgi:5-methylcytosine-specific restriction endonuclease McrA